jgi:D-glycero-beta-D-manno-heptose-7-phosphate kinase
MIRETLQHRLQGLPIVVVGDLMLDRYLWGHVQRISPEAPVPIVDVQREEARLGGAANVALNLLSLGCQPLLLGTVGHDTEGETLHRLVADLGLNTTGLVRSADRRTTTKTRVLAQHQQMLRVDKEDRHPLTAPEHADVLARFSKMMALQPRAVIFEDYDKGLLNTALIATLVQQAQALRIPTFVDPKFRQFFAYTGVTVFKPNLKELREGLKAEASPTDIPGLVHLVHDLRQRMPHDWTLITLSEHGVLLVAPDGTSEHIPAHRRSIVDVSGAGDTVIATLAATYAAGLPMPEAAKLANLAGGLVCEDVGVVPIRPERLFGEQ